MKKWMAWMLTICLCISPVLACAQPVSTRTLIAQLVDEFAHQMERPALRTLWEADGNEMEVCFALDGQGQPDFAFHKRDGANEVYLDADAAGLRVCDGQQKIGVTLDTLVQALESVGGGNAVGLDVREEDLELLLQVVSEILGSATAAVSVTEVMPPQLKDEGETVLPITTTVVNVQQMLALLDSAVPAVLNTYTDALNALLARNGAVLEEALGSGALDVRELIAAWPKGTLAGMMPENTLVTAVSQGDVWTLSVAVGAMEIARMAGETGRVRGMFGANGEYVFDTDDLRILAQMAAKLPHYITDEALTWAFEQQDYHVAAHLKMNSVQLVGDVMAGLVSIVRDHQAQIEALIERYAPWFVLAGMPEAEQFGWEGLYQTLSSRQERISYDICDGILRRLQRVPQLRQFLNAGLPWAEMDLYAKYRKETPADIVLDLRLPSVVAAMTVTGNTVNASYTMTQMTKPTEHAYVTGFFSDSAVQLTASRQKNGRANEGCTIEAQKDAGGWTVLLFGLDGVQKAQLRIMPQGMRLRSGSLTADLTDTGKGFSLAVNDGQKTMHAQLYAYDGLLRAELYKDGQEFTGMIAHEKGRDTYRFTHREAGSVMHHELLARGGSDSLILRAGRMSGDSLQEGAQLTMQWSDQIPRVNADAAFDSDQYKLIYLPGELDAGYRNTKSGDQWQLHAEDVTRTDTQGNLTRVEVKGVQTVMRPSAENPQEQMAQPQKYSRGWTIYTRPEEKLWHVQAESDAGETKLLTLDFAAAPAEQDLAEYTWLTAEQVREMIQSAVLP